MAAPPKPRPEIRACKTCRHYRQNTYTGNGMHLYGVCRWLHHKYGLTDEQVPLVFLERIYGENSGCPCWERKTDLRSLNALLEQKYQQRLDGDDNALLENEILILEREAASLIQERMDRKLLPLEQQLAETVKKARELLGLE